MQCGHGALRVYWFVRQPTAVGAQCLITCEEQVLLIRHTYGCQLWTVPGGGVQPGEKPEEAICREVDEEVGIGLDSVRSLGLFHGNADYRRDTVYAFTAQASSHAYTIDPGEILEARWFPVQALPALTEYAQHVVRLWHEQNG